MLPRRDSWQLRDYQQEAIEALMADWGREWEEGRVWANVCAMATGLGKTHVGMGLIQQALQPGQRALWLAHRDILCRQPLERLHKVMPDVPVGLVKAENDDVGATIIIGSVPTLRQEHRMRRLLDAGAIDLIVTDECHHSPADSYQNIYKWVRGHNPDVVHTGLTATPWRGDGEWVLDEWLFQSMPEAAQNNIRWGIKHGYLVAPDGLQIETEVNIGGVRTARGDFVAADLADVLEANKWHELVVDAYEKHCYIEDEERWMTALAFTPDVATSKRLVQEFKDRGYNAVHVDGSTPLKERRPVENGFRKREILIVSNCAVYGEGADFPSAECILMARPTQSHGLFTQIVGRGLRPFPGKTKCLVLLFTTVGAHILTLFDLGKSKALAEAEKKAEELTVVEMGAPIPLFDDGLVDGMGTKAKVVSLFGAASAAWYCGPGGIYSVGLGIGDDGYWRTLVILPPNGVDTWTLMGLAKRDGTKVWKPQEIDNDPDLETLMDVANGVIERRACGILSHKKKPWRRDTATAGQAKFMRALGVHDRVITKLTQRRGGKGDAARLITHELARQVLRAHGYVS